MRSNVTDRPGTAGPNDYDRNPDAPRRNREPVNREVVNREVVNAQPAQPTNGERLLSQPFVAARDRVRWGPIWAGFITTISLFLLLELLAYSADWLTLQVRNGSGAPNDPWVTWLIALIAFFVGGWIAALTSSVRGGIAGTLEGFLVWGLATTFILAFSVLGLGQLFGLVGNVAGQFVAANGSAINPSTVNVNGNDVVAALRTAAWWAFLGLISTAIISMAGGWIGSRVGPVGHLRRVFEIER